MGDDRAAMAVGSAGNQRMSEDEMRRQHEESEESEERLRKLAEDEPIPDGKRRRTMRLADIPKDSRGHLYPEPGVTYVGEQTDIPNYMTPVRWRFVERLKRAAQEGVLLFAKHALYLGLWLGSGWLVWSQVATVRQQAMNGQIVSQWLQQNDNARARAIEALVAQQHAEAAKK